ncbi:glutathione S-transferase theta-1-like isoform X1 [Lepisosteus oculatus]|nr:PREDICTED: glutathione S-transferase theta-1-like isoform X1 [Lepisosteus oculatus]
MVLELYLDLFSQPCRSVYIFAKKNNIPFEFKKVALAEGQQYEEDFGKINPLRKVPVMKDDAFILAESIAILSYLAQKFNMPDHWYPCDLQKRARVNEYLSWQHIAIRMQGSKYFWFKLMVPIITGEEVPKEKMDSLLEDLNMSLKLFEEKFLQDRPFIIGEQISLADLVAIVEMMQPVGAGLDIFAERPKLSVWRDRVKQAIGKELFDEAHKTIMNAKDLPKIFEQNGMLEFLKPRIQKMFT